MQSPAAFVLAGTELPLLIRSESVAGLPLLDTTEIHVRAIVDRLSGVPGSSSFQAHRQSLAVAQSENEAENQAFIDSVSDVTGARAGGAGRSSVGALTP